MRILCLISLATFCMPLAGCARGNVETLEARLRSRESELRALNGRLDSAENLLATSQRENRQLQQQLAGQTLSPEAIANLAKIDAISINTRLTGALDEDGLPGDDVLNIVVSPIDDQGQVIKLDGHLVIEAIDPALPAADRSLGEWTIPLDESANQWHDGFLGQGYQLTAPWQQAPISTQIVLLARYQTPDGRQFSTTEKIKITPPTTFEDNPKALPLPQVKQELPKAGADIRQASFWEMVQKTQRPAEQTTADDQASPLDPNSKPLSGRAPNRPILLESLLNPSKKEKAPPFVE